MSDESGAQGYQWETPTDCPDCGFEDTLQSGSCRRCGTQLLVTDGGQQQGRDGARVYHPLVYGIGAMAALFAPVPLLFEIGLRVNRWYWSEAGSVEEPWELPYLTGVLVGAIWLVYVLRLTRTRAAWWFAYFEAWTETLNYPMEGYSDE